MAANFLPLLDVSNLICLRRGSKFSHKICKVRNENLFFRGSQDNFNDPEKAALNTAFDRGDAGALIEKLAAKGITTEHDHFEVFESLAETGIQPVPSEILGVVTDATSNIAVDYTAGEAMMDYVLRPARKEEETLPAAVNSIYKKYAILLVVNMLRASGFRVTREVFRRMVGATYKELLQATR